MEKTTILTGLGAVGGIFTSMLGGWDVLLKALVVLMIVDYLSGMAVAGVFHKSKKTNSGALKSSVGFMGLCKKGMVLALILVAVQIDAVAGSTFIRATVIWGFLFNEGISIVENAGLMGLNVPEGLVKGIDMLKNKKGGM